VRAMIVVKGFPLCQLQSQILVVGVAEQLIELLMIRQMRALHLSI
jgi:hypothetical protein